MHFTIFDTPIINTLMHWLSRLVLRLLGWRVEGRAPDAAKYVLIAAPHTSNWDFPVTLMVCFALRLKVYWMGKSSLFPPLGGGLMRWLGGIPVNRDRAGSVVQGTVEAFQRNQRLTVIISPRGNARHGHPLEDRLLPHRSRRRCAHHPRLPAFREKAGRHRPPVRDNGRHRCRHAPDSGFLCRHCREEVVAFPAHAGSSAAVPSGPAPSHAVCLPVAIP